MPAHIILNKGRVGDRAPHMVRGADLTGRCIAERHHLSIETVGVPAPATVDDWTISLPAAKPTLMALAAATDLAFGDGHTPIVLSSTCSASLATLPIVHRHHPDVVVLYIDGHSDFNTPDSTDTGYLGGMVLSGACGLWESGHGGSLPTTQAVLVGSRDIDGKERDLINRHHVRVLGPTHVTPQRIQHEIGDAPVWVHVDWDVLDPGHIPADYVVPNGLTPQQMHDLFAAITPTQLVGLELAEFNAPTDQDLAGDALSVLMGIVSPLLTSATSR